MIVLSNTLYCSSNHHRTKDIIAKIPCINMNGELNYIKINASYCFDCNRFTILKEDFAVIKDVAICRVIDEATEYLSAPSEPLEMEEKNSVLYNYGYKVKTQQSLSDIQRQTILSSVMEAGIMSKRDIINHLTTLIDRGSKISSRKTATHKWKQDKIFVSEYQNGDLPEVVFDEIIMK